MSRNSSTSIQTRWVAGLSIVLVMATSAYGQWTGQNGSSTNKPGKNVPSSTIHRIQGGWVPSASASKLSSANSSSTNLSTTNPPQVRLASYQQITDATFPSFGVESNYPAQPVGNLSDLAGSLDEPPRTPDAYFADQNSSSASWGQAVEPLRQVPAVTSGPVPSHIAPLQGVNTFGTANAPTPIPNQLTATQLAAFQQGENSVLPGAMEPGDSARLRQAQDYATGLPHVTPAPRQNYPTSPYLGPRRTAQLVQVGYSQPNPSTYVAQQQNVPGVVLPQNIAPNPQPIYTPVAPGMYPTTDANCAPSLPNAGAYVPPTITPNWNPSIYSSNNSGYRPLISLGQENYNVVLGRGLYGQPTAYVPGQYIRNFLRYIFP